MEEDDEVIANIQLRRDPVAALLVVGQAAAEMAEGVVLNALMNLRAAARQSQQLPQIDLAMSREDAQTESGRVAIAELERERKRINHDVTNLLNQNAQASSHAMNWAAVAQTAYETARAVRELGPEVTANPLGERPRGPRPV